MAYCWLPIQTQTYSSWTAAGVWATLFLVSSFVTCLSHVHFWCRGRASVAHLAHVTTWWYSMGRPRRRLPQDLIALVIRSCSMVAGSVAAYKQLRLFYDRG